MSYPLWLKRTQNWVSQKKQDSEQRNDEQGSFALSGRVSTVWLELLAKLLLIDLRYLSRASFKGLVRIIHTRPEPEFVPVVC